MSRRTALILTTVLTFFVLIVATAVAVRLGTSSADPVPASAAVDGAVFTAPIATEVMQQREVLYQQQLDQANAQLQQAYEQMQQLQAQLQQLQAQNRTLLEREQIYQQRLEEANRLLRQSAPVAQAWPSGPAGQLQEMGRPFQSGGLSAASSMISSEQAGQVAVQYLGGGSVHKIKLEDEHGVLAYEVKVGEAEVYVDAYTGQVVYTEHAEREKKGRDDDD